MRIAFLINSIESCLEDDTTIGLGVSAANRGHEVFYFSVGDGSFYHNGHIGADSVLMKGEYKSPGTFLSEMKSDKATITKISSEDLDVMYLRNDTSVDADRPWAKFSGILLGRAAVKKGVLVLNHPDTLAHAHIDKMYFEQFPEAIRPKSIITRQIDEIQAFYKEYKQKIILKPLEGSGGKDVYLVDEKEKNLRQIVESIARSGYVIAQEYLPEAKKGDIRLFMMNGKPLMYKGRYAAVRRKNDADFRTNMNRGGKAEAFKMTDELLSLAEILGPKLKQDGIFCVGLDIAGNKVIELNLTSPGGLVTLSALEKVDFNEAMIIAIENKLVHKKNYGPSLSNLELATME